MKNARYIRAFDLNSITSTLTVTRGLLTTLPVLPEDVIHRRVVLIIVPILTPPFKAPFQVAQTTESKAIVLESNVPVLGKLRFVTIGHRS
jgi:hypothetical protein